MVDVRGGGDAHRERHSVARGLPRPCRTLPPPCRGRIPRRRAYHPHAHHDAVPRRPRCEAPGVPRSGTALSPNAPMCWVSEDGDGRGSGRRTARRGPARDGDLGATAKRRRVPAGDRVARGQRVDAADPRKRLPVGRLSGPFGVEQAALLACGLRAVLSHWTAAVIFKVVRGHRWPDRCLVRGWPSWKPCRHQAASSDRPPSL